ncbi:unnamed protein product [Onchocerca flexuosa]|uniref:Amiloride-sensitive sodium channel n=1 Tax=Onchocerca flexuosa TaxID=387005 RepID=A0A183HZK6_9BILA|nr:unnamed protein product [Onchocerca flexuosa]
MLKVCSVGGTKLDCCAMSQKVLTDLGSCFVFSIGDMKLNQTQPGIYNGLQLILDAGINDAIAVNYAEEGNTLPIFSNNLEDGFRLYVRSENELAYSYTEGLSVSPAYRAYIALNLETFHFLTPENWGNCTHIWPPKSPQRAFRLPYTAQNCASLCQQIYYEQRINCTPLLYSVGDAHLNTCTPSELHAFMLQVADRTNNINGPECADNICPTSCVTHEYKASITYGYGFSESAMDWLTNINNNWTQKRIKENFAVVNIFYREMSYILNEQMQSTSLVDVLSNIGGNMGLFFGASVITVIELIIFLSKLAWIAFSSRRREYMFHKRQKERDRERRLTSVINIAAKAPNRRSRKMVSLSKCGLAGKQSSRLQSLPIIAIDFTLTLLNTRSTLRSEAVMVLSQMERLINWFKEVAVRRNLVEHAIKKEFFQLMGATKLHGCYRIYAGKTYGRLFWLLMAISTGVIFIIVLAELTKQYKAENVSTQVEIVYDYADGPSITICSHNPVRRNYIEELKRTTTFSDELLMYLLHIFLRPEGLVKMNVMESLRDGERLLQDYMLAYKNFTVESFVKEASFKCEEAFVQCAFEGIMFDCCNEKYSTAVITDLGYCFQFDWNKLSKDFSLSYHFGSVHGFQVMLDYQSYNEVYLVNYTGIIFTELNRKSNTHSSILCSFINVYILFLLTQQQNSVSGSRIRQPFLDNFETGFRLYVHDKNTVSYVNSEVLVVSPNTKLSTGLKPIKYQFLERSKGGTCCNTWPSTLHHNSTYSSSACKMTCLARHFYMNCGCVPLQYNILKEGRLCSPKEVFDCINNFKEIASTVRNVTYSPLCQNCAPECELFIYFTQNFIIHNILTSLGEYMKSLKQQYKLSYVRSISIMPRFFTNSWMLLYVKQHLQNKLMTYGLVKEQSGNCTFTGKIGSDMGLFYGASVISLFELILLLFKTIWALASPSRTVYLKEKANQERLLSFIFFVFLDGLKFVHDRNIAMSFQRPQRKLDHVMSLTLTPEQASAILEAETFVDSIYVPLRRDKVRS